MTYDGSYHISKNTIEELKSRFIYTRQADSSIIVTNRQLEDGSGYSFLGEPDPLRYAVFLAAKLRWDPIMLNDRVKGLNDFYDLFAADLPPPQRRKPKKGRCSDHQVENEPVCSCVKSHKRTIAIILYGATSNNYDPPRPRDCAASL